MSDEADGGENGVAPGLDLGGAPAPGRHSFASGEAGLVVLNGSAEPHVVEVELQNMNEVSRAFQYLVHNDDPLSRKTFINDQTGLYAAGGPEKYWKVPANSLELETNKLLVMSPPFSASYVLVN